LRPSPRNLTRGISVAAGFGAGFISPIISSVFAERTPRHLLGRVSSLGASLAWAGMPLGGAAAALAIAALGLAPALAVAGGVYLLSTTLPGLLPQWREMNRRPVATETAPALAPA
jgi:MFS family permease